MGKRRDFLKGVATLGAAGALPAAARAEALSASDSDAGNAWLELAAAMREAEAKHAAPPYAGKDAVERADARRFLAQVMQTSLEFWADADPSRPVFTRFVGPHKKLLGDNPDAIYFFAPVDPQLRYVVRGNVAGATYTSFTVERAAAYGALSRGLAGTLNDTEFDIRPDGSYEIFVGGPQQARNWLPLTEDAVSITTRHYFETEHSSAADRTLHIPLTIDPVPLQGPPPARHEAFAVTNLRRAATFFRGVALTMAPADVPKPMPPPAFVSTIPNVFPKLDASSDNRSIGFAAKDNQYLQTEYRLGPDEVLVMRGRFPEGRFANVIFLNRHLQTYDYATRRVSLNRRQTKLEPDGSFRMVVAHQDPGQPNWLDTEGRPHGWLFWRFLLAQGPIPHIETRVGKFSKVRAL